MASPRQVACEPSPRSCRNKLVPCDGVIRTVVRCEAERDFGALFPAWPWPFASVSTSPQNCRNQFISKEMPKQL